MESHDGHARSATGSDRVAPIRVLELRSVRGTGGGPEKTILYGTARTDRARFAITVCYIRDLRDRVFQIDARARELAVDYVELHEKHSFDVGVWPRLRHLVRERQIDIVHAHDYKTNMLAWLLGRRADIMPLSTAHGWSGNSRRERAYYAVDRRLLARFPAVIAVSGPIRRTLIAAGAAPERVHQIPNGVDERIFRRIPGRRSAVRTSLGFAVDDVVIGAIGRLEHEKRFDLLLDAVARVHPRPRVLIVGEGRCRASLSERALALGMDGALVMPGLRSDVVDLLQALDVYVQTSDTEGIPNAVLEAMAAEVPIVATDVGGTSELVTDGVHGLLVPKGDAAAIAAAITRSLTDLAATERRVRRARERVERELSFDVRMGRVEAIYQELCRHKRLKDHEA